MPAYVALLTIASFVAAVCAGFILAASPRQRATQLAASLAAGASWWALCEARWNAAPDAEAALLWIRLSTPGWAFLGATVPHLMARYLDLYPTRETDTRVPWLMRLTAFGYTLGLVVVATAWLGSGLFGLPLRVPWGWTYDPGPVLVAYITAIAPGITYAVVCMLRHLRSPLAVAPRAHRISIRLGILFPVVLTPLTDVFLPMAGVHFPRLGSTAYALFGLVALGTGLRYGMTFFTPKQFSEEILETLDEGVVMVTPSGLIRQANRGFASLVGRDPASLLGTPIADLLEAIPSASPDGADEREARLRRSDGESVPVSASTVPLRDLRGNEMGGVVVVRDLREIEELRRRMLIQSRLAAVGELVAGLAHEINNPLAFVRANLTMLERHAKALGEEHARPAEERQEIVQESRELIEESLTGVDRAAEVVRGVRRFTQAGTTAREEADLNELLGDCLAMLGARVQATDVTLGFDPGPLPPVRCAPHELRQVFLNLLVNALDAVGSAGRVTATTRIEGDAVVVEIHDDGRGMEQQTLERIFDPFFTTKDVGEGTGLGLGTAWNIVQAQGGHIEVRSELGVGTRFRVRLPVADAPASD